MNLVKIELLKNKDKFLNLLRKKDYKKLLDKMTRICLPFCKPPNKCDRTIFTPYKTEYIKNKEILVRGYVNYSEISISINNKLPRKYFAASKPKEGNIQGFRDLIKYSDIVISCIKDINYHKCPKKSTPYKKEEEIIFYDEEYEDCRILRYENWRDHDIPDEKEFIIFYEYYKNLNKTRPLVHCLAGVGRTGFFIMYDILHGEMYSVEEFIEIFIELRAQRNGLVYSEKQLRFLAETFIKQS
ncbi:hemolysin III-like putative integral membrane protein [Vairimorpha necatrix]|uniref:Hemolysin III-like putative integral membrane protein n=1 Tax=Vairimorpha necatrix TaxID=6039 RepID=A0AAX4J9K8_9MICR